MELHTYTLSYMEVLLQLSKVPRTTLPDGLEVDVLHGDAVVVEPVRVDQHTHAVVAQVAVESTV